MSTLTQTPDRPATTPSEPTAGPVTDTAATQLAEAGQRGHLQVAERVVVAIARAAAMEVPGVATPTQGRAASKAAGLGSQIGEQLQGAVGRTLPRAAAQVAGQRARITVEIALIWPHSAAQVAAAVREHVAARLAEYAAVTTDAVTVTVSSVVRAQRTAGLRRVQ
ncbi:Uncharacterized conserved protein YloU, alkaline shock protein (Asp23) family [Quadrisphaera granulorum]|uniref:Putative alkaline shock family protein YloU n=1 Tax=Quadrisphaera granulorum TaxID=317664 RepID=A0A316A6D1_9ACTN|nr:Asp23/Gls24 family envelope stress response protein [Quadrisphaera granulorum]PWJ52798.1 putative alkaline shock family protein YloU [Quadrisphaera granulorum]SZE97403.1 Uncharacterized conserved protein YloU, alkaline shock protein (Asp23) family [Quadrisphaera granulorum]